jgi:hypothetical protein
VLPLVALDQQLVLLAVFGHPLIKFTPLQFKELLTKLIINKKTRGKQYPYSRFLFRFAFFLNTVEIDSVATE